MLRMNVKGKACSCKAVLSLARTLAWVSCLLDLVPPTPRQ